MSTFSDQVRELAEDLGAKAEIWHAGSDDDDVAREVARCFSDASDALHAAANYLEEMTESDRGSE